MSEYYSRHFTSLHLKTFQHPRRKCIFRFIQAYKSIMQLKISPLISFRSNSGTGSDTNVAYEGVRILLPHQFNQNALLKFEFHPRPPQSFNKVFVVDKGMSSDRDCTQTNEFRVESATPWYLPRRLFHSETPVVYLKP